MTKDKQKSLLLLNQVGKICDGFDPDIILEAALTFIAQVISEHYEEIADIPFSEVLLDCIKIQRGQDENI